MITILCSGSRGDIQPYIALAQQLIKLGKDVRITAGASFEDFIRGYGIDFYPIAADLGTVDIDPKLLDDARSSDNPLKMMSTFHKMKKYATLMTEDMANACKGGECIIYHPGCTIGYFVAQQLGIPSVLASPFPMHSTSEVASVIAYGRYKLPNRCTYTLLQSMLWTASKVGVENYLKQKQRCPYGNVDSRHPAVISCSNYVFPRPNDWSQHIHQYGYWFVEEGDDATPPQELTEFLDHGEPPVYLGFGSVFHEAEQEHFVRIVKQALRRCGKRGIICGMGDIKELPDTILSIQSIPHSWLFPRVSAVCHHGGAGTTAAGFRAGVPSIIVPFSNDQFAWAHRAYDLGVGSKPIPKKKLTADALAEAITYAMQSQVKEKASVLARNIAHENGAADCARVVMELCKSARRF